MAEAESVTEPNQTQREEIVAVGDENMDEYTKTGEFIDEAPEWDSYGSTEGSSSDVPEESEDEVAELEQVSVLSTRVWLQEVSDWLVQLSTSCTIQVCT